MANFSIKEARKLSKAFNAEIEEKVFSDSEAREIYERKRREIEIALLMRKAREKANLSQEEMADRMKTTRSAVSRLESCGHGRHSPSVDTLLKYAAALGCTVKINLVPLKEKGTHD